LRIQFNDTDETKYLPKPNFKSEHMGIGGNIKFVFNYADKYSGKGPKNLLDGWRGPEELISHVDYSIWQGFEEDDLIAHIDLKKEMDISEISIGFLQFLESWIFLPDYVDYEISTDGKDFVKLGRVNRTVDLKTTKLLREEYKLKFDNVKARYLKVSAKNVGLCPNWHQGAGRPAWVFSDEITLN
ncbi:MAG: hypothetical protein R3250_15695, partial [Melioribacteraceae bacterium]|nr:hypothetical protein [Melioribacteraceae bacterium]